MSGGGTGEAGTGSGAPAPPDRVLARRVQEGDRDAYETLVRRYIRPIHGIVASFLAEPADVEDAAQDTFLRALDGIDGYDPGRPFAPWLYQIARNVARNRLDADRRRPATPLAAETPRAGSGNPARELELSEIRSRVEAAVSELPEQRRIAFRLFDIEGYSAGEVARIMDLAPGTVRSHVHHARRDLRHRLRPLLDSREER